MTGLRMTGRSNFGRRGRKSRGFTLVELIVILIIIAILAAAGVATALGYIKKTKFDKNNQSAISVYQTAQTALTNKTANGTIESWILGIPGLNTDDITLSSESETNYSQHKTISLTYNHQTPGDTDDKYLYEFLSPYIYYQMIFGGTMAVEFDICVTKDNGHLTYTANVLSAFYSSENDSATTGWDQTCLGESADGLPDRSESYRRSKSLVGYYAGSDDDANVVSAVTLPWDSDYKIEGHVVGPVYENRQAKGYLFNLRNAETLDVSWAIFDDDRDPERADDPEYTYQYSAREDHNEKLYIYLYEYNDDFDIYDLTSVSNKVEILVDPDALDNVSYGNTYTTYEVIDGIKINRESSTGFITLKVLRGNDVDAYVDGTVPDSSKCREYTFPITRCHVTGDPRTGCPSDTEQGYYEYRLSLDGIRVRTAKAYSDTDKTYSKTYYGSTRLFGDATPRNICAMLGEASQWEYTDKNGNDSHAKEDLDNTFAARAIDDPVYLEGAGMRDGELKYCYQVKEHCGRFDGEDDTEMYEDYVITGMCVVNTFFGDKVYDTTKDPSGITHLIGGTVWGSTDKTAVLTNCRHLYNISSTTGNDVVTYRVVSDINWYYHETSAGEDHYASDVRVFTTNDFNSPVAHDGTPRVVSFPAINLLKSNSTLTSISDLNKRVYSINNIQLRQASFINKTDTGYALICCNEGTIYNLYANNISNVFISVLDGAESDYPLINAEDAEDTVEVGEETAVKYNKQPVAALVGHNKGTIGSSSETADNKNTVRVSNSVVMSGGYWKYHTNFTDVGGVIGKNSERSSGVISSYGVIEVCGSFVVIGGKSTGGIIGYNESGIGARLVVDGSNVGKSEFNFPNIEVGNESYPCSCAVLSKFRAGGAIGYFDGGENTNRRFSGNLTGYSLSGNDFDELDDEDFNINVYLPEDGLIVHFAGNEQDASSGGAIACLYNVAGDYLSIKTNISGKIISSYSGTGYSHCGGAIGKESGKQSGTTKNSVVTSMYLDCTNNSGSLIGAVNGSYGGTTAGGAIGKFETNTTGLNRTVAINIVNNGRISARGTGDSYGAGGAVGGAGKSTIPFIIRVVNRANAKIIGYGDNITNNNGTGGALGGFGEYNNDNCYLPDKTWIFVENYGTIEGKHHVGGAIGCSPINRGDVYVYNYSTITGLDFVGGAVGRNAKDQYGSIYTVLDGATVSGGSFVGGTIGRCLKDHSECTLKTTVISSSTVKGTGSLVGGVAGDVNTNTGNSTATIDLEGTSSNPELTVKGLDGVGGAIGILRSKDVVSANISMPSQSDLDRLVVLVDGRNDVGGAIGRVVSLNSNYDNNSPETIMGGQDNKDIAVRLDVTINPRSHVIGTGDNVGGVVGFIKNNGGKFTGHINVNSVYGSSDMFAITIQGNTNVGGAVGKIDRPVPNYSGDESGISVDFTAYPVKVIGTVSDEATNANVGGVIGYIAGDADSGSKLYFPITAKLGTSIITSGGANVGGVIGYNNGSLAKADINVTLNRGGIITGGGKVGGAIGRNYCNYGRKIYSVTAVINGEVTGTGSGVGSSTSSNASNDPNWTERRTDIGTGDCIGGAIGYNHAFIEYVIATVEGTVSGSADSVGGAIGYCHSDNSAYWVLHIISTLQGDAKIKGEYNVGGAVGENICNIYEINSTIVGNAQIIGEMRIGGAVGFASAKPNTGGDTVRDGGSWGRIDIITATISADYALCGNSRIGGAVGQQGDKWGTGACYISAALLKVEAKLNTAYLFEAEETGPDNVDGNACVGGVFGIFIDGRVGGNYAEYDKLSNGNWGKTNRTKTAEGVILSGTGGLVRLDYPDQTYTNAVLISAKGRSVGGVIGQIGAEAYKNGESWLEQNVCMSDIKVAENGPAICVVSVNGADRIGGWIGSGFAAHGGIGADRPEDPMVTYNVNTVKVVFSRGDYVGGFCGYSCGYNSKSTTRNYTHAQINVELDNASIIGRSGVGGVFGGAACCNFNQGYINASFINRTNIGDMIGNTMPGDNTEYDAICYETGGVFGSVTTVDRLGNSRASRIEIPVNVTIDGTSRISGFGEENIEVIAASDTGVGGVFGRCTVTLNDSASIRVTSVDSGNIAVVSKYSNVGGIAGVMNTGSTLKNCCALVSVRAEGDGVNAGGVIGKMVGGSIYTSHNGKDSTYASSTDPVIKDYNYTVNATGTNSFAGGFAGTTGDGVAIEKCYSTARVTAENGTAAGGFVGQASTGNIKYSYASGRTYSGQYLSNSGDVTGSGNVGGFVGQTTDKVSFTDCYSTASVSATGSFAGGFVGSRNDNTTITDCYSTGLVIGKPETVSGAFAGSSSTSNYKNKSYAMRGINKDDMRLIGDKDLLTISGLSYADSDTIRGANSYNGYPFDESLGTAYPLRAVFNGEHWGDWPVAVSGKTSILGLEIYMDKEKFKYDKDGVTVENHLRIYNIDIEQDLVLNADYTLTYTNNDRVGEAQVMISGIGEYYGAITIPFTIIEKSIKDADVSIEIPEDAEKAQYEYTGAPIVPEITVKVGDDVLNQNTDYYLTYYRKDPDTGEYVITTDHTSIGEDVKFVVNGIGNYTDAADMTGIFDIVGRDIADAEVTLTNATAEELVYTGMPKTPGVVVRIDGRQLTLGTDYSVEYSDNVHAGEATITIRPVTDEYGGEKVVHFNITTATNTVTKEPEISAWTWKDEPSRLSSEFEAAFGETVYSVYSESTCTDPDKCMVDRADTLEGDGGLYDQLKNLDAGYYYLLAEACADEDHPSDFTTVSKIVPFNVDRADITNVAEITLEYGSIAEDGTDKKPGVTVTYKGDELSSDDDYDVVYDSDTISPGTKTVRVVGKGNCTGTVTEEYTVIPRYKVTFDPTGGQISPEYVYVVSGNSISEPEPPTKDGYAFDGWYIDAIYTAKYSFGSAVTGNLTLYAKWKKLYTITYVLYEEDGVNVTETQKVANGEPLTRPDDPTRTGYDFAGWYADAASTSNPFTGFGVSVQQDLTMYAHWTPKTIKVTFDTRDITLPPEEQTLTYPELVTRPADPVSDGYDFVGWYTDEDCTEEFDFALPEPDNVTLYAKWNEKEDQG